MRPADAVVVALQQHEDGTTPASEVVVDMVLSYLQSVGEIGRAHV